MSIVELGAIGEFVAAIAVVITLIYLTVQIRQTNAQSRLQIRQTMFEHDHRELYRLIDDPDVWNCFFKEEPLSPDEKTKFTFYLTANMRLREWEWRQYQDGLISRDDLKAYDEVTLSHLGNVKARKWWEAIGKPILNPGFVEHVHELLAETEPSDSYYSAYQNLDI
jgi:hypothetical protein